MAGIGASIAHNVRGLGRFSGRDTRGQFWPWAIGVFLLSTIATMMAILPILLDMLIGFQQLLHQPIDPADPYGASIEPDALLLLMPDFSRLQIPFAAINAVAVLLLAAGVTRRLHDRDKAGWWGLMPVPFLAIGILLMPYSTQINPEPGPMPLLATLNSLCSWGALIGLIFLLVGEGSQGANRYGDEVAA